MIVMVVASFLLVRRYVRGGTFCRRQTENEPLHVVDAEDGGT